MTFRPSDEIAACADESGIHDDASVCILAGYVASVSQWAAFDERWKRVLRKHDVLDFHSREFFPIDSRGRRVGRYRKSDGSKASFGDWAEDQASEFLVGLLSAINETNIHQIGAMVDVSAFRALTYGERKFLTGGIFNNGRWLTSGAPSKPYFLVYDHCLYEAAQKTKAGKKLLFIFDQQKTYESLALQQFGASLAVGPAILKNRYHGVLFKSRLEVHGLQAADLYAHCWHRYGTDEEQVGNQRRRALETLTNKAPGIKLYNAAHLEEMLATLPVDAREFMRSTSDPNVGGGSC